MPFEIEYDSGQSYGFIYASVIHIFRQSAI